MLRWFALVALLLPPGCLPMCAWDFDQSCASSDECTPAVLDPCNGCPDAAVNVEEIGQLIAERDRRRRFCPLLLEIECQPVGVACVDGRCELQR
jgi:hypothetical protein